MAQSIDDLIGVLARQCGEGEGLQGLSPQALPPSSSGPGQNSLRTDQIMLAGGGRARVLRQPQGAFLAAGRIKNRTELTQILGTAHAQPGDSGLMLAAYQRWGADCCTRLIGDWLFAAWDEARQELILARDHFGYTALYYQITPTAFAFSTSRRALLDLKLAPVSLDEAILAKILVTGPDEGEPTIHSSIRRLPPAHWLRVTPTQMTRMLYWDGTAVTTQHCRDRRDYIAGFRAIFGQAVRESLSDTGNTASQLSGGLDSGSVTTTAAQILAARGQRLAAYTSVPIADTTAFTGRNFGDEWPLAHASAAMHDNIDHYPVDAADITPMAAIRAALDIHLQPLHAAGNKFWINAIERRVRAHGQDTLLTGQLGNAGISWTGGALSRPLLAQWQALGLKNWLKECGRYYLPPRWRLYRSLSLNLDWAHTAIAPAFARRIDLRGILLADPRAWPPSGPLAMRLHILGFGLTKVGALHAESAAAAGIHITDPTGDPRVLAYCLSIPDSVFIDPATGIDRWVIREAMVGRLPDSVRLNRRRGRQAGDLVVRLRASAHEVEQALAECEAGPAAAYLNLAHLRQLWARMQAEDSNFAFKMAVTTLTRGLMAGLFVNGFGKNW